MTLDELKPAEASFELSEKPGKVFTLKKFSLATQIWGREKFGSTDALQAVLSGADMPGVAAIAFHLLKDKSAFASFADFTESVVTLTDQVSIFKAVARTLGVSQPEPVAAPPAAPEGTPAPNA